MAGEISFVKCKLHHFKKYDKLFTKLKTWERKNLYMYERIWANWKDFVEKLDIYPMIRPYLETSQITIHEVPAKTCISNAADEGYRIVYILQGSVKVVSLTYRGIRILLDEIGVGSFFGHISRMRGYSFDANIIAETPCVYLEFPDQLFCHLMENPAFALEFYRSTSSRTYQMYRKVLSLTLFTVEENTAMYCLMHPARLKSYTLDEICEEIGISRRSLCYVLKKWRKEGILKGKEKRDRIADHEQLMQIAEHIRQFYDIP